MKNNNHKINCNVKTCCFNLQGKECSKECICVKSDENGGTCCCSYQDDEE